METLPGGVHQLTTERDMFSPFQRYRIACVYHQMVTHKRNTDYFVSETFPKPPYAYRVASREK